MIKTKTKLITIQREEESIVSVYCDNCNKSLELINESYANCKKDSKVLNRYVKLTASHHDWGNDSVDSIKTYQFCSIKCCLEWIIAHEKELNTPTREFEIECNGTY